MVFHPETLDVAAATLSVSGTIAGSARLKISWLLSFLACIIYFGLFYQKSLFFNAGIHFIYLPLSIIGLYLWKDKTLSTLKIKSTPVPILTFIAGTCLFAFFYCKIHQHSWHYDFITSFLSINAFILMAFAQMECWLLWLTADILYIHIYSTQGLPFSLLKSVMYCMIAFSSFIIWQKIYRKKVADDSSV